MALREIGAKLTIEGQAEWNSQMKAAERQIKNNSSALSALTAEFAGNANSAEALRQKQQLLQSQYDQQKEKVRALTKAVEDASSLYGENAERTDKLRQSLNYAQAAMARTGRELEDVNGYLEEAERSADGCASSIDGYGRKMKDAGDSTDDLLDKVNKLVPGLDLTALKGNLTGVALAAAFKKAWDWAMELVESTEEIREGLGRIEAAAQTAGYAFDDQMNATLQDLYVMSGDMDSSFEALSNLLSADYSGSGMASAVNLLAAAVVKFPDTLKVESLADSLQETLASREATGQFSELLSRLGINVDNFTTDLQACTTQAEAQDLVFQTLASTGLAEARDAYEETAGTTIALREAEYDLQMAQARLAESFVPLKTRITELKTSWTEFLAVWLQGQNLQTGAADLIKMGISSGIAAGDQAGLSMTEILDVMERFGLTYADVRKNAREADQSVGEYMNTLAAQNVVTNEATASTEDYFSALSEHKTSVEDALVVLEELKLKYEEIRANIDSNVSGFTNMTDAIEDYKTTASDMIKALDSQIEYLNNYQENLRAAQDMGLSTALIEELSDGSAQSAAYLEAIVAGGEEKIAELNEKFAQVETGKQAFVETVAGMLPEFTETLDEVTATLQAATEDWNKYDEAYAAGENTISGLRLSILGKKSSIIALGTEIGNAFMTGYNSAMDIHSPSRRAARAMDFTMDGFTQEGRRRLPEMGALGIRVGEEFLAGYERNAVTALRLQAGGYAGAGSSVTNTRTANINLYPQTMDAGMTDYLMRMADEFLGGSV